MKILILVFLGVFLLNLIPAFAPPTWMVFSAIGLSGVTKNVVLLAVIGAAGATLGRLVLAKLSRVIIRQKFLSEDTKQNIAAIREGLQGKRNLTFGVFLFYAFSPLPSNYLFIAYGLTTMELKLVAVPFFLGRAVSYSLWGLGASAVARKVTMGSIESLSYLSGYFVASQLFLLYLIYAFTRVDWRVLFTERKLQRLPKHGSSPLPH
jgi:hypothetical protein